MSVDTPHKDMPNAKEENADTQENQQKQQPETPPPVKTELQIPHTVTDDSPTNENKKDGLEGWKFVVEILTLFAIGIYAIITYCQLTTMREATEATKKSADAATNAVEVARKTLETNIATNKLDRRPWIGVKQISIAKDPAINQKIAFEVLIENSGRSPAVKIRPHRRCSFDEPTINTIDSGHSIRDISGFAMAPGATFTVPVEGWALSENDIKRIKNKVPFYVFGTIHYIDSTDKIEYETTFCSIYIYQLSTSHFLAFCSKFNDMK